MTKKQLSFLNVNNENMLSREAMKSVLAGSGGGSDPCQVCSDITVACVQHVVDTWQPHEGSYHYYLNICENQSNCCFASCSGGGSC